MAAHNSFAYRSEVARRLTRPKGRGLAGVQWRSLRPDPATRTAGFNRHLRRFDLIAEGLWREIRLTRRRHYLAQGIGETLKRLGAQRLAYKF